MSTTSISIKNKGLRWLESAPITWDKRFNDIPRHNREVLLCELSDWLYSVAVRAARLAGYVNARGAVGCGDSGHAEGVKSSNRKVARVRKALGYTIAKDDLRF